MEMFVLFVLFVLTMVVGGVLRYAFTLETRIMDLEEKKRKS